MRTDSSLLFSSPSALLDIFSLFPNTRVCKTIFPLCAIPLLFAQVTTRIKRTLTGLSTRVANLFDGHYRRQVFRCNKVGTSAWMYRDNRFTLLLDLFLPDGTRMDNVVFLLWKGTFLLDKRDGGVKSPSIDRVQDTLPCHLMIFGV